MPTNFDEIIDRRGTASIKYDFAIERGYPKDVLPFWVADMDFRAPAPVLDALTRRTAHGIFGYTQVRDDYFAVLDHWFKTRHHWDVLRPELIITPGVVFAIATAIRAFTEPGDAVLIQQPVYYPFANVIRDNGRRVVDNMLKLVNDRYEIDFTDFEQKIVENNVKLFILCSPHNPVGRVWRRTELERIAGIGNRMETLPDRILVYSDDGEAALRAIMERGLEPNSSLVRRCSLEDVFLRLTGRSLID